MTSDSLAAAYAPFTASLLAGGFDPPADGEWGAELVAAHIVRNNDLIAEAAEQVAAGADVAYDNAGSVDEIELARLAEGAGGLTGLAREVERSAARLERAGQALGALAATPVHVIIRDGGEVVRDGPVPIGAFINGNASFHLDAHHAQLRALGRPGTSGRRRSSTPTSWSFSSGRGTPPSWTRRRRRHCSASISAISPRCARPGTCRRPARSAATTAWPGSASTTPAPRSERAR